MINIFYFLTFFMMLLAVSSLVIFKLRVKRHLYSYNTIFAVGFMLFCLVQALIAAFVAFIVYPNNPAITNDELYIVLSGSGFNFVLLTAPIVVIFSIMLSISNISLIRHEGKRLVNFLGILLSFALIFSAAIIVIIDINFAGNDSDFMKYVIISGIYCQIYSYLICMLFGTIICAVISVVREPELDIDYIIILGCKVGLDGRLYPLIKGRVDKAISFCKKQVAQTGKHPIFIPSGGKGNDEGIAEGQAMANYLTEQGILAEYIITEDKSRTTRENMLFSKALIEKEGAKLAFSTTNYHVLRSGIIAHDEGIEIFGIGAKTKWYFYPNAFIREFIGLMVKSYKLQISVLLIITVIISMINTYLIMD